MRCDECGTPLNPGNDGGFAPNGLPLYVCKECYRKLAEAEKQKKETRTEP